MFGATTTVARRKIVAISLFSILLYAHFSSDHFILNPLNNAMSLASDAFSVFALWRQQTLMSVDYSKHIFCVKFIGSNLNLSRRTVVQPKTFNKSRNVKKKNPKIILAKCNRFSRDKNNKIEECDK